jgi:deoxyribodipyrimidine photo-lyase
MSLSLFPPNRAEALARLDAFLPRAGRHYAEGRNADHGPDTRNNVSLLSPYVRHRLISEEEIVSAVLARHSGAACDKFIQEVLWRTYWKGWLEMRPAVWTRFIVERDAIQPTGGMAKAVVAAEAGNTGIEGFDDWAQELVRDGYLHNHARMWFASIWIFTLGLPWTLGADFFLRHLIDADPASNTLSWRWVAGLQTTGKTYLATADNIARYTNGRFRPKGLVTSATALTEAPLPAVRPISAPPAYDRQTPALLLITGEDCSPETLLHREAAICGIHAVGSVSGWPWGEAARRFVTAASRDAAKRAAAAFGCASSFAEQLDANQIIDAARAANARHIITPYAPVGPVADALDGLAPALASAGLPLIRLRREWDNMFWPYATKGFFPFKEKIPTLLAQQGLRF